MVSHKSQKKAKKPLETSLGKASSNPIEDDLSHLRKPIETSISGIKQVLSLLETATSEVKNFVMYECDIMYECRLCRTIFRSLANFILHKRNYCREMFNPLVYINKSIDSYDKVIENDTEQTASKEEESNRPLDKIIQKLHKKDQLIQEANNFFTADLSEDPDNGRIKNMEDREEKASNSNDVLLESIETNKSGMFQTILKRPQVEDNMNGDKEQNSMKTEVMEIHKILQNDVPVLDSNGKICGFTNSKPEKSSTYPKSEVNCSKCKQRFATQKSLTNHIKSVHNPSRIVYVCPTCKDTFANPWCVYRHLLRVHRMTNKQVRRLRDQIHNNGIRRDQECLIQKKKTTEQAQENINSENQWINDIEEDNAFQMCAGCGKRFERKAALHSHSQMCAKRLEVCNSIKENARKKEEEEAAIEKAKQEKLSKDKPVPKGASKRKCKSTYAYNRRTKDISLGKYDKDDKVVDLDTIDEVKNVTQSVEETALEIKIEAVQRTESDKCNISVVEEIITIKMEKDDSSALHSETIQCADNSKQKELEESSEPKDSCREEMKNDQNMAEESVSLKQEQLVEANIKTKNSSSHTKVNFITDQRQLIQATEDLLCNEVSFETFYEKVEKFSFNESRNIERKTKSPDNAENDDVIFVGVEPDKGQNQISKKRKCSIDNGVQSDVNDDNFLLMAAPYMDQEKLTCMPCVASFKSLKLLLWHMSAHFSWFRYQCAKCSFVTFNKNDCLTHLRKEHKVVEKSASTFILPLPNWKTLLMSHDFRLLKDSNSFGGKHTDEDISVEDVHLVEVPSHQTTDLSESDSSLFGDVGKLIVEDSLKDAPEKENVKRGKWDRSGIDLQDYKIDDAQKLPEPLELCMPADVSDVIRALDVEESVKSPDQSSNILDICDESNDDWLLCKNDDDDVDVVIQQRPPSPKIGFSNLRPCRIRTKTKMNEDFVYYD